MRPDDQSTKGRFYSMLMHSFFTVKFSRITAKSLNNYWTSLLHIILYRHPVEDLSPICSDFNYKSPHHTAYLLPDSQNQKTLSAVVIFSISFTHLFCCTLRTLLCPTECLFLQPISSLLDLLILEY